jgi:hypothetical protein
MFQQAAPALMAAGYGQHLDNLAKFYGVGAEAPKPVVLGSGQTLIDPITGKQIAAGPAETVKPTSVSPGESLVDPTTGKVLYTAPKDNKNDFAFEKLGTDLYRVNKLTGESTKVVSGPEAAQIQVVNGIAYKVDPTAGTAAPLTVEGKPMGQEKKEIGEKAVESLTKNVIGTVGEAKNLVGGLTSGYGGLLKYLPLTEARMLSNRIDTIKANLGFDRLQMMRDMSPTGGALGQVAVRELDYLQASIANLDQLTTKEDLLAQLDKIESHYNSWLAAIQGKGAPTAPTAPPAAAINALKTGEGTEAEFDAVFGAGAAARALRGQ